MQAKLLSRTFIQQLLMATKLPSQLSSDVGQTIPCPPLFCPGQEGSGK